MYGHGSICNTLSQADNVSLCTSRNTWDYTRSSISNLAYKFSLHAQHSPKITSLLTHSKDSQIPNWLVNQAPAELVPHSYYILYEGPLLCGPWAWVLLPPALHLNPTVYLITYCPSNTLALCPPFLSSIAYLQNIYLLTLWDSAQNLSLHWNSSQAS